MARFLSTEWFDEVNRLAPPVPDVLSVVIEQHVTGGPEGDVAYQVKADGGRLTVGRSDAASSADADADADVVLVLDYATAEALARGRLTTHDAFLGGRIRLRGGIAQLERAATTLAALAPFLAELAWPRLRPCTCSVRRLVVTLSWRPSRR